MALREKMVELLPEIDDIEDVSLRERVLASWMSAARKGNWNLEDLDRIPLVRNGHENPDSSQPLFPYIRMVTRIAIAMAQGVEDAYGESVAVDVDHLTAAGLLHEVGVLLILKVNREGAIVPNRQSYLMNSSAAGMVLAGELGVPSDILHAIASLGSPASTPPKTAEALILQAARSVNLGLPDTL